jgi:peptidoglycan/xylan/chitin deacetylase (PgdA/CDA1 family)
MTERGSAGRRLVGLAAMLLAGWSTDVRADPAPSIAITIDDIPAHGPLPPGVDRQQVMDAIIAALRSRGVSEPSGFLNAGFGADDPQSPGVVAAWRRAGFPLGNHTFAHSDLDKVGAGAFIADLVRNEPPVAAVMHGSDRHWFRYPFLHEGSDPAARDAVRTVLHDRRYRIAAVTMSFDDFAWNAPYARCATQGNGAAIASLEASYLDAARNVAVRQRALSQQLYARDIPYVLLLHVGAFDARMLPRLLDLYRAMGFRFVSLAVAEADPFYAAAIDPGRAGPSPTLEAEARAQGLIVPALGPDPDDKICP